MQFLDWKKTGFLEWNYTFFHVSGHSATTEHLNQDQPEESVVVGIETQHMIVVPKWILESLKSKSKEIMKSRNIKRTSGTIVGEIMELLKELEEMEWDQM